MDFSGRQPAPTRPSIGSLVRSKPPPPPPEPSVSSVAFEMTLDPEVLDERPHQTAIDFFAETKGYVLCLEAKWIEAGMGACSCGNPETAACSDLILKRSKYWQAAQDVFGLPPRVEGEPCRSTPAIRQSEMRPPPSTLLAIAMRSSPWSTTK